MNIVLFERSEVDSDRKFVLSDIRARHMLAVLKIKVGAEVRVGEIGGLIGKARVVGTSETEVRLEVGELTLSPPVPSPVELILALPRPKSLRRVLRAVANLGIKSVHLIHSYKVEKSYWTAPALEENLLRQSLLEGLSIAKDTVLPNVKLHRLFKPFVQDVAPHLVGEIGFVAHPNLENVDTAELGAPKSDLAIPVAIGPEGGFIDYEVGLFNEAGYRNLSIADRVYSVECAIPVLDTFVRQMKVRT